MFVWHFLTDCLIMFVQCNLAWVCSIFLFEFEDPAPCVLPNAPCASEKAPPFLSSLPLCALCKLGNPMLPWVSLLSLGNLVFFLTLFLLVSSILGLRLSYLAPLAAHVCMQVIWSDCTRWRRHAHRRTHTCSEQSLRILMWNASYMQQQSNYTWQEWVGD